MSCHTVPKVMCSLAAFRSELAQLLLKLARVDHVLRPERVLGFDLLFLYGGNGRSAHARGEGKKDGHNERKEGVRRGSTFLTPHGKIFDLCH